MCLRTGDQAANIGVACNPIWDTMAFADGRWQQFATHLRETIPRGAEIREASCQSRRKGLPCCASCWARSCGGSGRAAVSPRRKRRGRSAGRSRRSAGSSSAAMRSAFADLGSAALAAERAATGRGAVRAVHLAGVVRSLGRGVRAALALEGLAELALCLVKIGLGGSLLRGLLPGGLGGR